MIALPRNNSQQITTPLLSNARRVTRASERRSIEPESESGLCVEKASDVNWVMLVIWGFVAFSFAAFFFCGFILWAKCHGDWPL
jgi:hypothetical protein